MPSSLPHARLLATSAALTALAAGVALVTASSAGAQDGGRPLSATMTGAQEVNADGVPNQGDLDGTGTASVTVNPGTGRVCFDLAVANIDPATRAHIHRGAAGTNGAIVVPFFEGTDPSASSGCVPVSRTLASEIIRFPQDFYFNVHNAAFRAGAVRGQLSK